MSNVKPLENASQDFAADLAGLREDIAKLTASVSALVQDEAAGAATSIFDAVEQAKSKLSDRAAEAKDRIGAVGPEIEAAIERNPLTAVLVAMAAGLLIGMLSRSRK